MSKSKYFAVRTCPEYLKEKKRRQGDWSEVTRRVIEHEFREVERDLTT